MKGIFLLPLHFSLKTAGKASREEGDSNQTTKQSTTYLQLTALQKLDRLISFFLLGSADNRVTRTLQRKAQRP